MKDIVVKTERLMIHVASQEEMEQFIKSQTVDVLPYSTRSFEHSGGTNPRIKIGVENPAFRS